ncbi:Cytosolic endo-beta-N-acetylglucosaminidase [Papilio machaon]|uniref:Cytosolic endo-beta-N-acetylglucosaminidase n=1 Tax=Papilio machaon TaxID=76193 RepID=A0A0N0PDV5_PAPMA|nr:Cytosolic endo-beta-N-acetylglucosaminidase [Papilio machaon]
MSQISQISLSQELTCRPLDTYEEILEFLKDPPSWRTLCTELKPHSQQAIRNVDINKDFGKTFLETPQTFCHYMTDTEDLVERQSIKKLPKTLVCHDMANGYHDDCVVDGTNDHEAYTFYNWGGIDIFCYFSHHLVTIPPLGWINIGHAHGVQVIGTIITEWSEGSTFWENILSSEEKMEEFANALVYIAKTLSFDGWLLNVENKVSRPRELVAFVRLLHGKLHAALPHPLLIWYDSVTVAGHLNWQNCLNEKNRAFFDACDGIFTNYSWSENEVRESAVAAGDRLTDVYVGIDVWGRNFYGGGQFNTQEAVKVAHSHGCSLAVFAPAWTHEARSDASCDVDMFTPKVNTYEQFLLRERALWGSLWPYLNTKLPCALPFASSFCRGQGNKRRFYGEVISPGPWYNLRHMQYQPNSSHGPHGYLLSVLENIINASRHGLFKDKAEMTRCRRSLELTRSGLSIKDTKKSSFDSRSESQLSVVKETKSETAGEEDNTIPVEEKEEKNENEEKSTKSRKVTDAFRNLFKITPSKDAVEQPEQNTAAAGAGADLDTGAEASDTSMIQTSLNLRLGQNPKKIRLGLAPVPNELECLQPYFKDSFIGGSCLKLNPSDKVDPAHRCVRLLHCDFPIDGDLIACVVTKNLSNHPEQYLNVILRVLPASGAEMKIVLFGGIVSEGKSPPASGSSVSYILPFNCNPGFKDIQKYMMLNEPGFYIPVENHFGWNVRYYLVSGVGGVGGARVAGVDCRTGRAEGPILLGHFGLCQHSKVNKVFSL